MIGTSVMNVKELRTVSVYGLNKDFNDSGKKKNDRNAAFLIEKSLKEIADVVNDRQNLLSI